MTETMIAVALVGFGTILILGAVVLFMWAIQRLVGDYWRLEC